MNLNPMLRVVSPDTVACIPQDDHWSLWIRCGWFSLDPNASSQTYMFRVFQNDQFNGNPIYYSFPPSNFDDGPSKAQLIGLATTQETHQKLEINGDNDTKLIFIANHCDNIVREDAFVVVVKRPHEADLSFVVAKQWFTIIRQGK